MTVADIPDLQRGQGHLGSVVFSECFLESTINIQQKGKDRPGWSRALSPYDAHQAAGLLSLINL